MVNLLAGFISSILILVMFSIIEKKRVTRIGKTKYLFILIVMFSAFISNSTNDLFSWILWMLIFYTVLDDLTTQTVFTPIYIVVVICLFFKGHTVEELVFAVILFVIFLLFSRKTKETFFSIGDSFVILALAFWMGKLVLVSLLLAAVIAGVVLPVISLFSNNKYYPFSAFLVISSIIIQSNWYVAPILLYGFIINIFFGILIFCIYIIRKILGAKKKKH